MKASLLRFELIKRGWDVDNLPQQVVDIIYDTMNIVEEHK
jgi:hypothetical protein